MKLNTVFLYHSGLAFFRNSMHLFLAESAFLTGFKLHITVVDRVKVLQMQNKLLSLLLLPHNRGLIL